MIQLNTNIPWHKQEKYHKIHFVSKHNTNYAVIKQHKLCKLACEIKTETYFYHFEQRDV